MDEPLIATGTVVGAGVIGSGWAARMRLHGMTVRAYDPNPEAERILNEVQANANAGWDDLGLPTSQLGDLVMCESIEAAVHGAGWIQESVPEVMAIKHATLAEIDAHAAVDALIGSSTSGFTCTEMATPLAHPDRMFVAHPFNPVYMLPLVEVVGGDKTSLGTIDRAMAAYRSISMHPLHVRVEIDAHIADRLLEAVWREGLWLVNDGVATTEEIDDAIRYGFGLRWAQMGLFETYRIAGGEGGMAHFIKQFGPTMKLPWTKLMDVPELTDELCQTVEDQSNAQSGAHSIRELERIRDRNLAGFLKVLESNDWGAGNTLAEQRNRLGS